MMLGLIDTAVVYTPDPSTGNYTTVDNPALRGRLAVVTISTVSTGPDRAELATGRRWLWGPGYALPETAQLEVDGQRWNVVAGSLAPERGPAGNVLLQRADVVRVTDAN